MFTFLLDLSLGHSCSYKESLRVPIPYTQFTSLTQVINAAKMLLELGVSHILPSTSPKGDYHCDVWIEVERSWTQRQVQHNLNWLDMSQHILGPQRYGRWFKVPHRISQCEILQIAGCQDRLTNDLGWQEKETKKEKEKDHVEWE